MTFLLIGIVVAAALVWARKAKKRQLRPFQSPNELELDEFHRGIVDSARRLADVINESLKIANESKDAATKVSRLDVAKKRLGELKHLSKEYTFIEINQLLQVEQSIFYLDGALLQAQYREIAGGNLRGQSLEKEGKTDDAITEYERLLEEGVDTPFTYRRLAIIYSKRKEREEEIRVLRAAIKNVPVENSTHYQSFAERIAKKS